jgi:hypothetical protein
MKKIVLIAALMISQLTAFTQNNSNIIGFDGIGDLKLGISGTDIEKLLKIKIVFKHIGIDERFVETITASYRGGEVELDLMGSDQRFVRLDGISTTNPVYKTKEGIGIGSDQATIINTYEKHLLIINKDYITYAHIDDIESSIVFTMQNKKVVKITIEPTAAFRDRE